MRINPKSGYPGQTDAGVTLAAMQPDDGAELRAFCLATIAEAFGYAYRTDWHADLDELLDDVHLYHPAQRGALLVARRDGEIMGCGGLRAITSHPALADRFAERYPDLDRVGAIWRVYISPQERSRGLGAWIASALEHQALSHGYDRLYLHTSARTPRAVAFWRRQGYESFSYDAGSVDDTVHMDKPLSDPGVADAVGSVRVEASSGRPALRDPLQPVR